MPEIADVGLELRAAQDTALTVPVSGLPAGDECTTWGAAVFTVRADPDWPRGGSAVGDLARGGVDPSGWAVVLAATDFTAPDDSTVVFALAAAVLDLPPGARRYACDVWRADTGKAWQVVRATWLTVLPRVR